MVFFKEVPVRVSSTGTLHLRGWSFTTAVQVMIAILSQKWADIGPMLVHRAYCGPVLVHHCRFIRLFGNSIQYAELEFPLRQYCHPGTYKALLNSFVSCGCSNDGYPWVPLDPHINIIRVFTQKVASGPKAACFLLYQPGSYSTWNYIHDDVIKWKHFPRCWSFVRRVHRWSVNSPRKGQWRGAVMFSLICA